MDVLQQPDALTSVSVPVSLRAVLQEVFSGTWNTVVSHQNDASNSIMRSVRGTRPGDPVADLAFTCAMRQILRDFVHDAHALLPALAPDDQARIPPITWVDDVAVFLEADTSAQVLDQARTVVRMMAAKCRSYGLDINFSPGKSEVLFHFHGREAATLRAKLYVDKALQLGEGCWSEFQVPVTSRCTHLGVIHSANLSFDAGLQYRLARGREALRECRKTVLTNQAIPASRRWALANSLILSRVFFACEICPVLLALGIATCSCSFLCDQNCKNHCQSRTVGRAHYICDDSDISVCPTSMAVSFPGQQFPDNCAVWNASTRGVCRHHGPADLCGGSPLV